MTLKDSLQAMSGKSLAAAAGVHPVTVCAWKRGSSLPPSTRIPQLAQALGMPVAELAALVAKERLARARKSHRQPLRNKPTTRRGLAKGAAK